MPYVSKKKYKRRTKRTRRPRRKTKPVPPLWPTKKVASLRYADTFSISSPVGDSSAYIYSCNGMFDPNITGTGDQPRGFDQVMPFYDHYVVIGAKAVVTFQNQSEVPVRAGIIIRDVSSGATQTLDTLSEYRHNKYITLDGTTRGGRSWATVTYPLNPGKFLGRSKPLADDQLKGSITTNPSEQCFYQLYAYPLDGDSTITVVGTVRIDYSAAFIEPKLGTGS